MLKDQIKIESTPTIYIHLRIEFFLDKITKGLSKLNTWTLDADGVKWSSQKFAAAVAAKAKAKLKVLKEDTSKGDK